MRPKSELQLTRKPAVDFTVPENVPRRPAAGGVVGFFLFFIVDGSGALCPGREVEYLYYKGPTRRGLQGYFAEGVAECGEQFLSELRGENLERGDMDNGILILKKTLSEKW